ncbi:unnamed protein product [Lampetra fluviatilis]
MEDHAWRTQLELLQQSVAQLTVALAEVGARTYVAGGGTHDRRDLADVALPTATPAPATFALAAPEQGAAIFSVTLPAGAIAYARARHGPSQWRRLWPPTLVGGWRCRCLPRPPGHHVWTRGLRPR